MGEVVEDATPILQDQLVLWMRWAVAGWLDENNIRLMNHCMMKLPTNDPIIEIGTFCGVSSMVMARIKQMRGLKNRIISVDPWRFEGANFESSIGSSSVSFSTYREFVKKTYMGAATTFFSDDLPVHLEEYSDDFFVKWKKSRYVEDVHGRTIKLGGPISMAYIDGDHSHEVSKADFAECDRQLVPGGFIIFDDSADGTEWGSHRTAKEVLDNPAYRLVTKGPNYCFQKVR